MFRRSLFTILIILSEMVAPKNVIAQEFNLREFEDALNLALEKQPGLTVELPDDPSILVESMSAPDYSDAWAVNLIRNTPEFGFVVNDADGVPVELLSGNVPFEAVGGEIKVIGYDLPEGYRLSTVGPAEWANTATEIVAFQRYRAPSRAIEKVISTVSGASAYIAQELCDNSWRPTEIVLHLTAGFELVFSGETGSQFTWDLELVCARNSE